MKIIATNTDGALPVTWYKRGTRLHRIEYGEQVWEYSNDMRACRDFGKCVRHSLECAGKLDWTDTE